MFNLIKEMKMFVRDIRVKFKELFQKQDFAEDGNLEIVNASFIADEPFIFGNIDNSYTLRELQWYKSQSLKVSDIPGDVPKIWQQIASTKGEINSNYGWAIFSKANGNQYEKALTALLDNPNSRQAVMIYIRPSMHEDSTRDGMKDFMCTYSAQMLIRKNRLHYIVNMRSNDAVYGYKNDFFWQQWVRDLAFEILSNHYTDLKIGNIYWNAGSLHVYPRHFELVK